MLTYQYLAEETQDNQLRGDYTEKALADYEMLLHLRHKAAKPYTSLKNNSYSTSIKTRL
jgi:hypothetical protein